MNWKDTANTISTNPIKAGFTSEINYLSKWMGYKMPVMTTNEWISQTIDSTGKVAIALTSSMEDVPSVIGMGARDAMYLLEKLGLHVRLSGLGLVQQQSLKPGTKITPGENIFLNLGIKDGFAANKL